MRPSKFLIPLLAVAVQAPAETVVYTDSHHPPLNAASGQVVYLDAPDTIQRQVFGELPADPVSVIHRHQDRAYYRPGVDHIMMPEAAQFDSAEDYYSTLLHELVHSTGHASRLAREGIVSTSRKFGDPVYGFEELIAEMGAAFLCAELGIHGDLQHESYIASWLQTLKEDNRAVFRAARFAREAFEYLVLREQALAA